MSIKKQDQKYKQLISKIGNEYINAKHFVIKAINNELIKAYWQIGRYIIEFEQDGKIKADYGSFLLDTLSKDLKSKYGKGFSRTNLVYIRLFYIKYPKSQTLSDQLSWSHYVELLAISNDLERNFYEKQTIKERWSIRELKKQKKKSLFERLANSKNKKGIIELSQKGQQIQNEKDLLKDPYILDFIDFPEKYQYTETELEQKIIDNLQYFLLELGKGFAFVGRQYRITLNNTHYFVDLVFYHIKLKCYVLIDLKVPNVKHYDIGQMNMYLGYFAKEENEQTDNEPIGILLTKDKDEVLIEYATYNLKSNLFVSKYQAYMPDKKVLKQRLQEILND